MESKNTLLLILILAVSIANFALLLFYGNKILNINFNENFSQPENVVENSVNVSDGASLDGEKNCPAGYYIGGEECIGPCETDGLLWHTHSKRYTCKECDASHPCANGVCTAEGECV